MLDAKVYSLLKVAEYRSYTQAARSLNLTQPAVSQHIHALEEELGTKLFVRNGNRLHLTKAGEKAVSAAKALDAICSNLKYEISDTLSGTRELNIGITHTMESNRISEAFAKYASDHRDIRIKLITDTEAKLRRKLKNYELDLAIIDGSVSDKELKSTLLDTDRLVLIVDPSHPLAEKQNVKLQDIYEEKLILRLPGSGTGNMFISSIQSMDISIDSFNVILEIDNIATIKDLVRQRYGVSILAQSACMDEILKKKLIALPIDQLNMKREINILSMEDMQYTDFLKEIINIYHSLT